jgi:hypothetical protein
VKLRSHIYPRIQEMFRTEAASVHEHSIGTICSETNQEALHALDGDLSRFIFFKNDRIYHHKVTRFHFTTYDVRRGTDIINPGNTRCNIMLLPDNTTGAQDSSNHHFLYARVLGSYHANVIYTGPGMRGYQARRLDFLWVRWYEVVNPSSSVWSSSKLDSVRFPPMTGENSFGFVDPKDVLRGCHVMPVFAKGRRHSDGIGISRCAKDGQDYHRYYVGR